MGLLILLDKRITNVKSAVFFSNLERLTMNKTASKIVVLGSINADYVINVDNFPRPGETLIGQNYAIHYGGKGANQAVASAQLGGDVDFIACIGADAIGSEMKHDFQQKGINTQAISTELGCNTGVAMIQVNQQGENSIVLAAGANAQLTADKVQQAHLNLKKADYLLLQLETPLDGILAAIKLVEPHTTIVLNPAPAQTLPDELLRHIDIITPNETETERLSGITITDEASLARACIVFHQKGINTVIITLGAKGVFLSQYTQQITEQMMITGFQVTALDTTAAGDTFNGGLVSALASGKELLSAIRFAQAAAALSVTRHGAQSSIPTKQEVENFLI